MQNDGEDGKKQIERATTVQPVAPASVSPPNLDASQDESFGHALGGRQISPPSAANVSDKIEVKGSHEEARPPLPPRPSTLTPLRDSKPKSESLQSGKTISPGSNLQSKATTAVSRTDIQTQSFQDGTQETYAATAGSTPAKEPSSIFGSLRRSKNVSGSQTADTASIKSFAPTLSRGGESESILGDVFGIAQDLPTWQLFGGEGSHPDQAHDTLELEEKEVESDFYREFDAVGTPSEGQSEGR